MNKAEAIFIAVCVVAPGGLVLLGVIAVFSPRIRKNFLKIIKTTISSIKEHLD